MQSNVFKTVAVLALLAGCTTNGGGTLSDSLGLAKDSDTTTAGVEDRYSDAKQSEIAKLIENANSEFSSAPDQSKSTKTIAAKKPKTVKKQTAGKTVLSYTPPQIGTVFTWQNNWANLPKTISYKVTDIKNLGPKEYVVFTSVKGFKSKTKAYYDTTNFALKGYRDAEGKALVTYKPVEQRYRFPMKPGDKWVTNWKSLDHKTNNVTAGGGVVQVVAYERLKLPSGEFDTLKVRMPVQKRAPKGLKHYVWFAPKLGITVKETIGGGNFHWSQVLSKVSYPSQKVASN